MKSGNDFANNCRGLGDRLSTPLALFSSVLWGLHKHILCSVCKASCMLICEDAEVWLIGRRMVRSQ